MLDAQAAVLERPVNSASIEVHEEGRKTQSRS
jgi:hypothetical protein